MASKNKAPQANAKKNLPVATSAKAGLIFPVAYIQGNLRKGNYADKIGTGGAVFLASVLEYLSADVLELAGDVAKDNKNHRINPRHIMMAIINDSELYTLLGDVQISGAGAMPFIPWFKHSALLPKSLKTNKRPQQHKDEREETDVQSQEM